jgi:hypothetical protein
MIGKTPLRVGAVGKEQKDRWLVLNADLADSPNRFGDLEPHDCQTHSSLSALS